MPSATIYHGTPLTPRLALRAMEGRAFCVSYWRPDDADVVEEIAGEIMYDSGAFSEWQDALANGAEWFVRESWGDYFDWLRPRLGAGRWFVMPDAPGAPSQINDSLLRDIPADIAPYGAPVWHMNTPISRLLDLCSKHDRVCMGWVGAFDDATGAPVPEEIDVGCEAYWRVIDEVDAALGNRPPLLHQFRGILVAQLIEFIASADATTLAQNGHRYDGKFPNFDPTFLGRRAYADRLEAGNFPARVRSKLCRNRDAARGARNAPAVRRGLEPAFDQLGFW